MKLPQENKMKEYIEKFDWKDTLFSNVFWGLLTFIIFYLSVKLIKLVELFEEPEMKLLALIIVTLAILKLMIQIRSPKIVFKAKEGKIIYS